VLCCGAQGVVNVVAACGEGGTCALVLVDVCAAGCVGDFVGDGAVGDATYAGVYFDVCFIFKVVRRGWVGYYAVTGEDGVTWRCS